MTAKPISSTTSPGPGATTTEAAGDDVLSQAATHQRILDAAELLFAEHGFDAASMRQITTQAGVNLAAAHYHFGDKETLFVEVFRRRVQPINRERLARLAALPAKPAPTVEHLVRIVIEPMRALLEGGPTPAEPHPFLRCMSRTLLEGKPFMRQLIHDEFGPFFIRLVPELQRALPKIPAPVVLLRVQAMMGALLFTSARVVRPEPLASMLGATPLGTDMFVDELVAFAVAGLGAPTVRGKKRSR